MHQFSSSTEKCWSLSNSELIFSSSFRPSLCSQKKEAALWEGKFPAVPNQKYSIKDVKAATPFFPVGKGGLQDQIQLKKT